MKTKRRISGVLFDLDGTLVDTAPDLVAALNLALADHGFPTMEMRQVRAAASNGSLALVNAAQPDLNDEIKAEVQQRLLHHYRDVNGQHACLFDGMAHLLSFLEQAQIPCGVVTNKAACFARPLIKSLGLVDMMPAIVSGDSTTKSKPDAGPMLLAASQIGLAPETILYLGDARRDLEAARNAGMFGGIAHWGYIANNDDPMRWPHDFLFDNPESVLTRLHK